MNHTPTTDLTDNTTHILTWWMPAHDGIATSHKEYHSDATRAFHRALQLKEAGAIAIQISDLT